MNFAIKKFALLGCCAAITLGASACTPTKAVRGNLVQDYQLAELKPGIDTQYDVVRKVGSPTTKAPFNDNVWYYMGQETEKRGVLDPEVTNERVMALMFNPEGLLLDVQDVSGHRLDLPYVRGKTPTSGNDITMMQQFMGNLGRFNKETHGGSSATTGTGGGTSN